MPAEELACLKAYANNLRVRQRGMSIKNRKKVAALKHESNLARLFIMPMKIARTIAELETELTWSDALLFQKALALVILVFCPLRLSTLSSLRIDQQLMWEGSGMSGGLLLEIPEGQLKNSHPASMPLPKQCADLIRTYIKRFRPLLAPEGSPFLFTGEHADRCKDPNCLGKQMKVLVHEKLGFDVNAHLFRHLVHIVVLNKFPWRVRDGRARSHSSEHQHDDTKLQLYGRRAFNACVPGARDGRGEWSRTVEARFPSRRCLQYRLGAALRCALLVEKGSYR